MPLNFKFPENSPSLVEPHIKSTLGSQMTTYDPAKSNSKQGNKKDKNKKPKPLPKKQRITVLQQLRHHITIFMTLSLTHQL